MIWVTRGETSLLARLMLMLGLAASGCAAREAPAEDSASHQEAPPPPPAVPAPGPDAALPTAETGFIDVPAQRAGADATPSRMFYAFRAADESPDDKPLLVVFNGGPGSSTTSALLACGTGPYRVEAGADGSAHVVPNEGSLTRFANVLWIDQRLTGFSYAMGKRNGSCAFGPMDDAADFVRVVTGFIAAHPRLAHARVGIVGESYGGARALAMVHEILHAHDAIGTELALGEPVTRWLGGEPTAARIAERMLGLVLIQPLVLGSIQLAAQISESRSMQERAPGKDPYDLRQPFDEDDPVRSRFALEAFTRQDDALALFGVDVTKTPRLAPADRALASRTEGEGSFTPATQLNEVLTTRIGPLGEGDRYYDDYARRCAVDLNEVDPTFFLEALLTLPVFITDAKFDSVVRTHFIFDLLAERGFPVATEPGHRLVTLTPSDTQPTRVVSVRVAPYDAGHMVPETQPVAFANDVRAWLAEISEPR